uniref:BOS complex subunit TMEM147 n=1 Tax=Strongyloides venezuelensis TaxID=75913 RepID=A0A0K0F707_STRVS
MPVQAGIIYFLTQFIKLMIMATFFPHNTNNLFTIPVDISNSIADIFDIIGIYLLIIHFFIGKPEIRCLSVGLGWSFAHSFANYFPSFILEARGTAFDYKYICSAIQCNIDLVYYITLSVLLWLYSRNDIIGINRFLVTIGLLISVTQPILQNIFTSLFFLVPSSLFTVIRGILNLLISVLTLYTYIKSPTIKGKSS